MVSVDLLELDGLMSVVIVFGCSVSDIFWIIGILGWYLKVMWLNIIVVGVLLLSGLCGCFCMVSLVLLSVICRCWVVRSFVCRLLSL